jgi:Zn-dependent protease
MSVRVGSVAGIPIRIHLLLPVVAVLYLVTIPGYTRPEVLRSFAVFIGVIEASIFLHECGHAFTARRQRLRVHEINLGVLGGSTCHDRARGPGGALRIALAGVTVNLLLAAGAGIAIVARGGGLPLPTLVPASGVLEAIWALNLSLAALNLLPGLPFDGGLAVEALLSKRLGPKKARLAVIVTGGIVCGGLVIGGLANENLLLAVLGGWGVMEVVTRWRELRESGMEDDRFLGVYDFSEGRTSLDASGPEEDAAGMRRERAKEKARRDAEKRETVRRVERESAEVRLDRLLERIQAQGISSLTEEEKAFLNEESRRLRALQRGRTPTRP